MYINPHGERSALLALAVFTRPAMFVFLYELGSAHIWSCFCAVQRNLCGDTRPIFEGIEGPV